MLLEGLIQGPFCRYALQDPPLHTNVMAMRQSNVYSMPQIPDEQGTQMTNAGIPC